MNSTLEILDYFNITLMSNYTIIGSLDKDKVLSKSVSKM